MSPLHKMHWYCCIFVHCDMLLVVKCFEARKETGCGLSNGNLLPASPQHVSLRNPTFLSTVGETLLTYLVKLSHDTGTQCLRPKVIISQHKQCFDAVEWVTGRVSK